MVDVRPPILLLILSSAGVSANVRASVAEAYGKLPLLFEPCVKITCGHIDKAAMFISRGRGYSAVLTTTGIILESRSTHQVLLRMTFAGANSFVNVQGENQLRSRTNYCLGSGPRECTAVANYARVRYRNLYPGIDLVYHAAHGPLEYDLVVAPRADPRSVRIKLTAANKFSLGAEGDLIISSADGEIRMRKPRAYQDTAGARQEIGSRYVLRGREDAGFELSSYDTTKPLLIDPAFSYLGLLSDLRASAIAADGSGAAYLAGTSDLNLPGNSQVSFVAKLNPDGSELRYLTYLAMGGPADIAADPAGNTYVTGAGAYVAKLDPRGFLTYFTFLGMRRGEGNSIAVDSAGSAYVVGTTVPGDTPTSFLPRPFVAKLNATGSSIVYSTLLEGFSYWFNGRIAVDLSANAYITGVARPDDFATTPGAYGHTGDGVFVAKLNATGSAFLYSTFLGRSSTEDRAAGIAVDIQGNAYVAGTTRSGRFPVVNALQSSLTGSACFRTGDAGKTWIASGNGLRSADLSAFAIDPVDPVTVYAAGEGVFKSTDRGGTWSDAGAGLPGGYASALVMDPRNPATLYAAVGDKGVFKSSDRAQGWSPTGFPSGLGVTSIAIDPAKSTTLHAGAGSGVWKSVDGGATWRFTRLAEGLGQITRSLVIDPTRPDTLYAAFGYQVFKSLDGGNSWRLLPRFLGDGVYALAIDPANPTTLYAGGSDDGAGSLAKSADGGETWTMLNYRTFPSHLVYAIAIDPQNPSTVYAAGGGVLKSTDSGRSWSTINSGLPRSNFSGSNSYAIALDPNNPEVLYAGVRVEADAFVAKLNPAGSALIYGTYLGGGDHESGESIAVDAQGNAYLGGYTFSAGFPWTNPPQAAFLAPGTSFAARGAFLAKLNPAGSALLYSTSLRGPLSEFDIRANFFGVRDVALDASGGVYALDRGVSTFIAKIVDQLPVTPVLRSSGVGNTAWLRAPRIPGAPVAPGMMVTLFGANLAAGSENARSLPLPKRLLDTSVLFNGIPAPLFSVSGSQVIAQVPYELPLGMAQVQIRRDAVSTEPIQVKVVEASPGIFTGEDGAGILVHASGFRPVTADDPARSGEFVSIFCTGLGAFRQPVASGTLPPVPPPETAILPRVVIDGKPALVTYSGAAPGFPGLYQVNVQVPGNLQSYLRQPVQIIANGTPSNTVWMPSQ